MNTMIWIHEGKDYTAKALTENDWEYLAEVVRGKLLDGCKHMSDPAEKSSTRDHILGKDYSRFEILGLMDRKVILKEVTYYVFKDNKDMTKDLALSFWVDEGFGINGFFDGLLEASGIPIKVIREGVKEVIEEENPPPPDDSAEKT